MGSYTRPRRSYKLTFDEDQEDMAGLVVRVRGLKLGRFLEIARFATMERSDQMSHVEEVFETLAENLIDWNLKETDEETGIEHAVPPSKEGLYDQDADFGLAIFTAWVNAMSTVGGPLVGRSTAGSPSPAASLTMVPLSPAPPD